MWKKFSDCYFIHFQVFKIKFKLYFFIFSEVCVCVQKYGLEQHAYFSYLKEIKEENRKLNKIYPI